MKSLINSIKLWYYNFITVAYHKFAKESLFIEQREVNVKKGKRRYTLLIFKDGNEPYETVFNIGRY